GRQPPRRGDRVAPQSEQLLGGVVRGGPPLPVGIARPVDRAPRRLGGQAVQPPREPVVLDERQVLEQPAQRHGRGGRRRAQRIGTQPGALPFERLALIVEEPQELVLLAAFERWFRSALFVHIRHVRSESSRRGKGAA